MATYVLVHGACHDGSAFDRVVERLRQQGHAAYAPTVDGHGKDVDKHVTHAESTQSVLDFIMHRELTDVVLLGHSYGGTIIAKIAEVIPERVSRLVFFSALVANDGETMMELFPPGHRELFTQLAAASTDNTVTLPFNVFRDVFINDADLDTVRQAYGQLSSEPFGQLLETGPQALSHTRHSTKRLGRDRGHGDATRGMGMAPETVQQARHVSPRSDAGKPRADVQQSGGPGGQDP
jgi:pimeloyl-ACP methyl ester carboxylesterase